MFAGGTKITLEDLNRALERIKTYAPQYLNHPAGGVVILTLRQTLLDSHAAMTPGMQAVGMPAFWSHELKPVELQTIHWALHQIGV
jgi:hypothetical protein